MYIFAEPVTEEQVAEIQSHNEAKIKEFERKIVGLTSDEAMSQETEEDDSNWDNIQADVRETMDKDELSIEQPNGEDVEYDDSENSQVASNGRGVSEEGLYANRQEAREVDEATAAATGSEDDDIENEADKDDELVDTEEDEVAEEHDGEKLDQPIDEADEEQDLDEESLEEAEDSKEGYGEEVQEANESEGQEKLEGSEREEAAVEEKNTYVDQEDRQADDQSTCAAVEDRVEVKGNKEPQTESNGQERQVADSADHTTPPLNHGKQDTGENAHNYTSSLSSEGPTDFPIEADKAFLNKLTEELSSINAAASQSPDILAMTLTIRNKVNGKFVLRPEQFTKKDNWSIEYWLTEVDTETRARALYQACQNRRKKKYDKMEAGNDEERLTGFLQRLRELSMQGRKWRARQDKEDTKKPVQILGDTIGESSGEGNGGERRFDD